MSEADEIKAIERSVESEARHLQHSMESKITHELVNSYVRMINRYKFLFTTNGELQYNPSNAKLYKERIGSLVGRIDSGEEVPSDFIVRRGHIENDIQAPDGSRFMLVMPVSEAIEIFVENNGVQYKAADTIYNLLKERASEMVKTINPDEFISPVKIGKEIAGEILGMDIPVDPDVTGSELRYTLEDISDEAPVPANDIVPGLGSVILAKEPFAEVQGRLENKYPTNIYFYFSTPQSSSPCLDLVIVCVDEQRGDTKIGTFNLKVGYDKKQNMWKQDVNAIGRKIIKVLREQKMTDPAEVFKKRNKSK